MSDLPKFESGFAEINGVKLYYECAGSGDAVVLVHAGIADRRLCRERPFLSASAAANARSINSWPSAISVRLPRLSARVSNVRSTIDGPTRATSSRTAANASRSVVNAAERFRESSRQSS